MIQLAQFDLENTQEHGKLLLYDSSVTQTDRAKWIPYWEKIDEGTRSSHMDLNSGNSIISVGTTIVS
jgi:hypothetical protein